MTPVRERTPYWQVPPSQQPLRVRDRRARPEHNAHGEADDPLEQLVILPAAAVPAIVRAVRENGEPVALATTLPAGSAHLDVRYADDECEHGRLPGDRSAPCGCWPQEKSVPDLIPDWVLADAVALRAGGMTWRKVASAILPVTDCADIPSCEQMLKIRLEPPKEVER